MCNTWIAVWGVVLCNIVLLQLTRGCLHYVDESGRFPLAVPFLESGSQWTRRFQCRSSIYSDSYPMCAGVESFTILVNRVVIERRRHRARAVCIAVVRREKEWQFARFSRFARSMEVVVAGFAALERMQLTDD